MSGVRSVARALLRSAGTRRALVRSSARPLIACSAVPTQSRVAAAAWRSNLSAAPFSTAPEGPEGPEATDVLDENRFMELADTTLHDILNWLDGIDEMLDESDISLAQGVLKIDLGDDGTWVINRQIPNRQIWWSSPISGPRRYEYDATSGEWVNTRDGTELMKLLRTEIRDVTGIEIFE